MRFRQALYACTGFGLTMHPVTASSLLMSSSGITPIERSMILATTNRSLDYHVVVNNMHQLFVKSCGEAVSVNLAEQLSLMVGRKQIGKDQGKGKGGGSPPT